MREKRRPVRKEQRKAATTFFFHFQGRSPVRIVQDRSNGQVALLTRELRTLTDSVLKRLPVLTFRHHFYPKECFVQPSGHVIRTRRACDHHVSIPITFVPSCREASTRAEGVFVNVLSVWLVAVEDRRRGRLQGALSTCAHRGAAWAGDARCAGRTRYVTSGRRQELTPEERLTTGKTAMNACLSEAVCECSIRCCELCVCVCACACVCFHFSLKKNESLIVFVSFYSLNLRHTVARGRAEIS